MNEYTMIVTNDHGRHDYDFRGHGDNCEGCRHIMLLIIGPDTPKDKVVSAEKKEIDIAPTVGYLLGFETIYSKGEILKSAVNSE